MPPIASKPDPENSLIRALRMCGAHFLERAAALETSRGQAWVVRRCRDAADCCAIETAREIGRMRAAGEASS